MCLQVHDFQFIWWKKSTFRSWQDSNLQSPDPKSGALSIRPHDPWQRWISILFEILAVNFQQTCRPDWNTWKANSSVNYLTLSDRGRIELLTNTLKYMRNTYWGICLPRISVWHEPNLRIDMEWSLAWNKQRNREKKLFLKGLYTSQTTLAQKIVLTLPESCTSFE